jgi:cell wall-associated NlpC family hydrolase
MSARAAFASIVVLAFPASASAAEPVELAADLIGRPYVWGAEGPNAFDCSGLMQYIFAKVGIDLPRRAIDQSRVGDRAGQRLERGDLLFFSSDTRRSLVTHVGIYEGEGVMINASKRGGKVRRDDLDDEFWAGRFMFARRIDDARDGPSTRRSEAPRASSTRAKIAARVLGQVAEILLRRR